MRLSTAKELHKSLKVDTTTKFNLYPTDGTQVIEVYKTKPAKYICSVEAFESIGYECQVVELDHKRRKKVKNITSESN